MSFYGNIKRVNSSPYVFDKIYANRKEMDAAAAEDGIYIGRYVLVKYTCKYVEDENGNVHLEYFDKYISGENDEKEINHDYLNNVNEDISYYGDTFDATVWQKIYTNVTDETEPRAREKYILIAELNAAVPRMEIEPVPPKYEEEEDGETVEKWRSPEIVEEASTEDAFKLKMPDVLHLDVDVEEFYPASLVNPERKTIIKNENNEEVNLFQPDYNYIHWENEYAGDSSDITGKVLKAKLYAFGKAISNVYDILFGTPISESGEGPRPSYTAESYNGIGLMGILNSIGAIENGVGSEDNAGRSTPMGSHYYLISKWADALEDPDHFIENIPEVIGASPEKGGSKAKSHYYIDFNNANGSYISKQWE